jgi:hypothetical protein
MKAGLVILCALPFSTHAALLTVEYEGTVYSADAGTPYQIGDTVSGRLFVDTLLMGPDLDPLAPNNGVYGADPRNVPKTDFVTGFADGLPAYDSIYIRNDFEQLNGFTDTYQITDASAFGTPSFKELTLYADLPAATFANDRGAQVFDVVSRTRGDLLGTFASGWDESRRQVDLYLSRLSVKPGRCHP